MTDPARLDAAPAPADDDTGAREAGRWVEPLLLAARHLGLSVSPELARSAAAWSKHAEPDAAGKVIEAFGHFLVGGNYTVGIVL
ncbi:hypothetical protein ACQCQ7_16870, partial [Ralstonia pseudosolanacearum]|uniref:hypothetical protein n=1 Tax=Ralstonia pseudosolanacearum TaxID=1310165 RepID=UPI003CFB3518